MDNFWTSWDHWQVVIQNCKDGVKVNYKVGLLGRFLLQEVHKLLLLLVHLKLGLAVLLVIVVDFVLFKFLFLKPLLALLLGFVKDRLH